MVEGTYIFDCEVFAHDWLFVFKEVATGEYTVIWNDNDEVLAFMERNPYLGGFNNKHYDNHILKAVMCGFTPEQVKEINDLIIVHELNGWDIPALREYRVYFDSFDLKDDCQDGVSLKGIEARLRKQRLISMLTMFSLNQKRHRLLTTVSTMWTQQRFFSSCGKVIWITKRL